MLQTLKDCFDYSESSDKSYLDKSGERWTSSYAGFPSGILSTLSYEEKK